MDFGEVIRRLLEVIGLISAIGGAEIVGLTSATGRHKLLLRWPT